MVSITLSVSEELKREMEGFQEINWSAVARQAISEKINLLKRMNALLSKSKLTEEDAVKHGKIVTRKVIKRLK